MKKKYIYPKLPAVRDWWFFRIGGNGLANCLFIYARAIIRSNETGKLLISPTWFNLSVGTYFRGQKDKRHYARLFNPETSLIKKTCLLLFRKNKIETIEGLSDYFISLKGNSELVRDYIYNQIPAKLKIQLPNIDKNIISVHIRLGDYPKERRTPIDWYISVIKCIKETGRTNKFHVFSDGTNNELKEILLLDNVERKEFGNALVDIWAMSQSKLIIASDSTFSAWAAYLNQVPVVFNRRHFPPVLDNQNNEVVIGENINELKVWFLKKLEQAS